MCLFIMLRIDWSLGPEADALDAKLDRLALYLALAAPVFTGLPLWSLTALLSAWQFRASRVFTHTPERFALTIPFRWQTFAYPLPGLRAFLTTLGHRHGPDTAL